MKILLNINFLNFRSMMESVDEQNHEDSFGDNNIFDPEL